MPFLLLSIVHWESMDFMVPALQFYWGSCLLPILCFIAVIERRWILGSLAFVLSLFLTTSALPLYPLVMIFYLIKKQWKCALGFGALSGIFLGYFFSQLTPDMVPTKTPDILFLIEYTAGFMGNILSNGSADLKSVAGVHEMIGVIVIGMGLYGCLRTKGYEILKFIFVYALVLALLAVFVRGGDNRYAPSRYALFAQMGLIAAGYLFVLGLSSKPIKLSRQYYLVWASGLSVILWAYSIYMCFDLLQKNKKVKNDSMVNYQITGDKSALAALLWGENVSEFGETLLLDSKTLGIYDFSKYKSAYIESNFQE